MSGILGLWNLDGEPVDQTLLRRLSSALVHRAVDGEGCWIQDSIALAFQNLWVTPESLGDTQPLVRLAEHVVCFDGRLDNRQELARALDGDREISGAVSDAAFVSAAYRKFGPTFAEKLNGDFAVVVYDIRERKLLLARDPIGVCPLYFARAHNTFIVASEVKPILAHDRILPKPNADMLAAYLLACNAQERQGWTFFDGVSSVLPGQLVTLTTQSVTKRIYWDFDNPEPLQLKSFGEYAEAFRDSFDRAVARRLRSAFPVAVSLSGGLDSSSIFCTGETLRLNGSASCPGLIGIHISGDSPKSNEDTYVQEIERQYAAKVLRVSRKQAGLIEGSREQSFIDMEAPYLRAPLDSAYPFERKVRDTGARVLLAGTFADQMVGGHDYWIDLFVRGRWLTVWAHMKELSAWTGEGVGSLRRNLLADLIRYPIPIALKPYLRDLRRRWANDGTWYTDHLRRRARHVEALQCFSYNARSVYQESLYTSMRARYYAQALEWTNKCCAVNGISVAYPFWDRDFVSFLLAIPWHIPSLNGVPKMLLRASMSVLPDIIRERRWKADTSEDMNNAAAQSFAELTRRLKGNCMAVQLGYLDAGRLESSLDRLRNALYSDNCVTSRLVGDLVGLEIWLQSFFGNTFPNLQEV